MSENTANSVYDLCVNYANERISWYRTKKRSKKTFLLVLRSLALILLALGAAVPILATYGDKQWMGLGYPLIAAAGGIVVLQRLMGLSSNWGRFMLAAVQIEGLLHLFRMEWNMIDPDNDEDRVMRANLARGFIKAVNAVVEVETSRWVENEQHIVSELQSFSLGSQQK